eukprot:5035885-Pyramimonas_sp.AAC.1
MRVGLVGVRARCRARAGIFFVGKSDRTLRVVIDGRGPSAMQRRPPSDRAWLGRCAQRPLPWRRPPARGRLRAPPRRR